MTTEIQAPLTVLRVDASVRRTDSITRDLANRFIDGIATNTDTAVLNHDLADGLPLIDEEWVGANFTPDEDRTEAQRKILSLSDTLIGDIKAADILVFGLPIYNFGVPAALKAWVDLIARARVTFRYTENGPEGLLKGKKAYLLVASGGTPVGADFEFATSYMKQALSFVGIEDVTIIAADKMMIDAKASLAAATGAIDAEVGTFRKAA